jgi:predicted dehydrogenase
MNDLRAGVVGAGVFAGFHARKYAMLPGVTLAGVYDPYRERAEALTAAYGGEALPTLEALIEASHVVSVATPAVTHAEVGQRVVAAGRHIYMEKPVAQTLADAEALVAHAGQRRLVVAVGHQERVAFAAMGLLDAPELPLRLASVRRGPPGPRSRDVSCVLDLMVHDLDLALQLGGDDILSVHAAGDFDEVRAQIVFRSGLHADLEASRVALAKERTMRLEYDGGVVQVDFLAPSFRNTAPFALNAGFAETPEGRDPLGVSLGRFCATVRGEADRPVVTGEEGLAALALALRVEQAAGL